MGTSVKEYYIQDKVCYSHQILYLNLLKKVPSRARLNDYMCRISDVDF